MEAAKYLVRLRKGMDASDVYMVEAVKLAESKEPGDGNAVDIAAWTGGEAQWRYSPAEGISKASVEFIEKREGRDPYLHILREGQWVLCRDGNTFTSMDDDAFNEMFHFHAPNARYTCHYCLADMRNTQISDEEKNCPNCRSGYTGPPRTHEFNILKAVGMVLEDD